MAPATSRASSLRCGASSSASLGSCSGGRVNRKGMPKHERSAAADSGGGGVFDPRAPKHERSAASDSGGGGVFDPRAGGERPFG